MSPKLHLQIDERSGVPVYRQMMDQFKYYVAGGTLRPGDQIPSIRELAAALAVNPTTVVKAYTELEREGVIEKRHGKGAFVSAQAPALTSAEQGDALRRSAKLLAVEATQMQVPTPKVITVVREELGALSNDRASDETPVKFAVVTGGR
ncbi:MAG TPA: GntR family transcriptional regulator [Candidatus Limnocylindria bacterium]|jgi:GntR family transcriptional regulator|nr:GntR family transcriptional regulator [Candidatus Limnocylindria bacterium]